MLLIGNQTSCWAAVPNEPFDYALAQGFAAFEWFPDKKPGVGWDESDLEGGARRAIREAARAAEMRLSVHARWQANPLAPDSDPLLWKDLELACDLGAALLNLHLFHEQGLAAFVEALAPLVRRTAEAGLQLAIENTPEHSPEQFNELFGLLRGAQSLETRHVGMCLDLGHANLCAATRNDYLGFFDRLDPGVPIIHLHLHENWGEADTHLPLFTGPAGKDSSGIRGLLARLRRRRFSGSVILEQWPHPPSLLNEARDRLTALWEAGGEQKTESPSSKPEASPGPAKAAETDFTSELVAGNIRWRSWREKLDFARGILARESPPLTLGELVDVAIYLRFLGTGEIPCVEDGRHFRPAHHARIASEIQARLAELTTADNAWIVRKIFPALPSSAPNFRRAEPLTRIRDIAHRNDIGPELKREIKTTLQNKLHRCAGPEDLATSAALLERITAPGANFPPDFVEQFRIFHDELKEFFNAQSLNERLEALIPSVEPRLAELIREFQGQSRQASKGAKSGAVPAVPLELAALRDLTALRRDLLNTAANGPASEKQELVLADIGLEDFAFVLLSEMLNRLDAASGWTAEALVLVLQNVSLSGVDPGECAALESEFRAWGEISPSTGREDLLRVRATALRCRRLAEDFGARNLSLFAGRVEALGRALGVAEHAIRVFAESEIRSHNVFQLSKLVTSLLRELRQRLKLPPWDILVTGKAAGRVRAVDSLDTLEETTGGNEAADGPFVVVAGSAAGDEEIPPNVAAIVLAQEIPHLSHLGVRARQAGIVFVACEEPAEFQRLQSLKGRVISLVADPDKVTWESASSSREDRIPAPEASAPADTSILRLPATFDPRPSSPFVPLEQALPQTVGGKGFGARRLAELSRQPAAGFQTPAGFLIPFGVMEAALAVSPVVKREYERLLRSLDRAPAPGRPEYFATVIPRLRELVQDLPVPDSIVAEAKRRFPPGGPLIVRSSANCEDLEEFAGAGLYESVLNVALADVAAAIRTVWASLWTQRAALSRRRSAIPHADAHMAVLVQELLSPDFSFVLHTVNPLNHNAREVYAEVVVGLGETLVSASTRGSPYRFVCNRSSGDVTTLAFANFSQASRPGPTGGLRRETIDYSRIELSCDAAARTRLGRRLAAVGAFVEKALQRPQDIEGALVSDQVYLVQSRPQTGLTSRHPSS